MKEKAIGKIIGGLVICLMLGLVFGGLIDATSATSEKTTVSVTDSSPWFTKGSNSGHPELWYSHTYQGHNYISTYVGGMSGNPSQSDCWAEFKPYLSQSGKYEVYAYFYACKDTSTKVPFTVKYDGGSTTIKVNQYRSSSAWKEKYLGTWDFAAGSSTYVKVTDATGETYNGITGLSVGTIKFVKVQTTTVSSPPTLISPGLSSEPGQEIDTLTPTFNWNSVSNADYYGLYVSKYPYGSGNIVFEKEGIYGTSFTLPSGKLQDGVKYRWNMRAHNSAGWSGFSSKFYFTVDIPQPPSPPTLISPGSSSEPGQEINALSPTFNWNSVSNADYYGLYVSKHPYGSSNIVFEKEGIYGTSFTIPSGKLQDGVKYRWNMRAHNSAGWSGFSSKLYFTVNILNSPPNTPSKPSGPSSGYTGTAYSYSTSATDPDGDQVKYAFDWGDGTTSETSFVNSGTSASKSHSWSSAGTYSVKAKATDSKGASSGWSSSKTVTITQLNNLPNTPSRPSGPSSGYTGTAYSYSTSATDPDGDQVKYAFDWGDGTTSETSFVNSGTSASKSHSWSSAGTYSVKAKATDSKGASSGWSSSKTVTITQLNNLPNTPSRPSGPSSGYTGTAYSYSTSATDPDGDQVKYTFDWGDGTTSETSFVNSGTSASKSHSWSSAGTYSVKAKATDSKGASSGWSSLKTVTITKVNNQPNTPSRPSGPSSGYTGTAYSYSTSATDPDGDQVKCTFDWGDGTTSETSFVNSGTSASKSHSWSSAGTYSVKAKAADSKGASSGWSSSKTVTITKVNNQPNTPSRPSGPSSGYTGTAYSYSTSATDPDGDQVKYTFDWRDGQQTTTGFYNSGATATASHSWSNEGTYYVKVKAMDSKGASSGWSGSKTVMIERLSTISIKIDEWSAEPQEVKLGEKVTLKFKFTNTRNIPWTFYAALSLRRPDNTVDNSPSLKAVTLSPTQQGSAEWTYTMDMQGKWDVVFGVWKEEAQKNSLGSTGWLEDFIRVAEAEHSEIPVLNWPLKGEIEDRRILLGFGDIWTWTYCGGLPKKHTGLDLKASVGEDVYAAYDGVVKAVYALSSKHNWGKGVVIEHSGFTTTYMHVNPVVNVDAHVNKGQKIAILVNIDGDEHLHFGARSGTYSDISKRGALPQKHGASNYQDGRFTWCKSDPLFPEKFVDPMKLKYENTLSSLPTPDMGYAVNTAIDKQLLDLIDQHTSSYYNSTWNLNINQYKAWIATIAWAEGGRGGYAAHSQYDPGSDVFDHRVAGKNFRFSTGIGPFQIDRGGYGYKNYGPYGKWGTMPTIEKLNYEKSLLEVLTWHYKIKDFGKDATLADFSKEAGIVWYGVKPKVVGTKWKEVTGTNWNDHKKGKANLDWSSIKDRLVQNAKDPSFRYENNVKFIGTLKWNIKENEGIKTDTKKKVIFDGFYPTWLITSRNDSGSELFKYYYTHNSTEKIEVWIWDNFPAPVNKFRYIFVREYSTGPFPEGKFAGETLTSSAIRDAIPVITASLRIVESSPYYVGDTITGQFTIANKGTVPITFDVLTIGGRDPDDQVTDFTWSRNVPLNPSESYNYQGTLTLTKGGNYHFFCAYQTSDGSWNTAIPREGSATNVLDIIVNPSGDLTGFGGLWLNRDKNTRGITKIEIKKIDYNPLSIHPWGKCHPTDCDWGARTFEVENDPFTITWAVSFCTREMTFSLQENDILHVHSFTHFTDNSDRPEYHGDGYFENYFKPSKSHPPTANARGPYYSNINETIQFNGFGTDPDRDEIVAYGWDFNSDKRE